MRAAEAAGVTAPPVLEAMRAVDRAQFVPPEARSLAYDDAPVPIGSGQTTSQPSLIAAMVAACDPHEDDRVLEVGSGHGYQTALLAHVAAEVWSIERFAELAEVAQANLAEAGVRNATVSVGDGTRGWPEAAPFDAVIVSAATPTVPDAWNAQLVDGGRVVVPVGGRDYQEVVVLVRRDGQLERDRLLTPVRFVPLVPGEQ